MPECHLVGHKNYHPACVLVQTSALHGHTVHSHVPAQSLRASIPVIMLTSKLLTTFRKTQLCYSMTKMHDKQIICNHRNKKHIVLQVE